MRAVFSIARNTVSEALSRIVLQTIVLFALMALVIGYTFTWMTPGEQDRMLKDLGLTVISIFGLVLAIFMGISLIQPEIERRTIYALLAKPVRRSEFVIGKYLGAVLVLAIAVVVMGVVLVGALRIKPGIWSPDLLIALVGIYLSLMIMTALVMLVSTIASSLMSMVAGFVFWAIGYSQIYVAQLLKHAENTASSALLTLVNTVLPNFTRLDLRPAIVDGQPVSASVLGLMAGYGLVYALAVLAITAIVFNEREM